MTVDVRTVEGWTQHLLAALGEDSAREGLVETPRRVAAFWKEWMDYEAGVLDVTFEAVTADQMVVFSPIAGWSLCEHHLLPFSFVAHVGYITGERLIGLSKVARIVKYHAHSLQVQERLTAQIAESMREICQPRGVGVVLEGFHTCAAMRGIEADVRMVTSYLDGIIKEGPAARAEFFTLMQLKGVHL